MNHQIERTEPDDVRINTDTESYDYAYVHSIARIAFYDDLLSTPRITEITPAPTPDYITNLASTIYEQAKSGGGAIPYTVIQEVSENFIHAQFREIIVSILDKGNTIRFADQGPGIKNKDKAQLPGFTSAKEPMKHYIRGVGSGLPIVKEYLDFSHGSISIEDNLENGSVITISVLSRQKENFSSARAQTHSDQTTSKKTSPVNHPFTPPLSQRKRDVLSLFLSRGALGVTDVVKLTDIPLSSTHKILTELEQAGLIEKTSEQKKRILTDIGYQIACSL